MRLDIPIFAVWLSLVGVIMLKALPGEPPIPPSPIPAAPAATVEPPDMDAGTPGLTARVTLEPDPAKIFTITWSNLPPAYTNGYRIESSQDLAEGWRVVGTSTAKMSSITYTTRTGPNSSYYRLTPLVGLGGSPIYILHWVNGTPEIIVWEDPDADPDPEEPTEMILAPSDDVYLESGVRRNDKFLKVEAGRRVAYLKFNVAGIDGTVTSSRLELREGGDPGQGVFRVWRGSHDNWTETTITATNAPAKAQALGLFEGTVNTDATVSIDLGQNVGTNGVYTIILEQDAAGANDVWFGSKESTNAPSLLLTVTP